MDLLASLTRYGQRVGLKPILRDKKFMAVACIDLSTGALTELRNVTLRLPQPVARGSNAATTPNRTYDSAQYLTNRESAFWPLLLTIVGASKELTGKVKKLLLNTNWSANLVAGEVLFTDGVGDTHTLSATADVVLTYKGEPLAESKTVQDWLSSQTDGGAGTSACLITGELRPISRLHRGIRSGTDKLVSHNESSSCYLGLEPSQNFPVSVIAAELYASGLSYLMDTRREPANSLMVVKDVSLVVWPDRDGVTHPIISAAITVLRMLPAGPSKPERQKQDAIKLDAAWREVDAVSDSDQTDLCMAILGLRKIRYIPIAYGHTTAAQLKAALQLFRADFEGSTFRQVADVWISDAGEASDDVIYSVLWAVLNGKPYPLKVTHLTKHDVHEYTKLRWFNAYNHRRGSPLMSFKKIAKDFEQPPTREQYYSADLLEQQNKFYLLGQLVDVYCRLKQLAQHKDSVNPAVQLKNALGSPQRSYYRMLEHCAFHVEKIRKKRRNLEWESEFNRIVMDYDKGGIGTLPAGLVTEERALVTLGYWNQRKYAEHLLTHWQLLRLKKENRVGDSGSGTPSAE